MCTTCAACVTLPVLTTGKLKKCKFVLLRMCVLYVQKVVHRRTTKPPTCTTPAENTCTFIKLMTIKAFPATIFGKMREQLERHDRWERYTIT